MRFTRILGAASTILGLSAASADVTAIGEFTGDMFEGFEGIAPPGSYSPVPLFNGQATMIDTLANMAVITFVWSGPGGQVEAYNGNLFGGTPAGSTLFTFTPPVVEFGGYITTVSDIPNGTVVFRDADGAELASLPYTAAPTAWAWQGWRSDTPIATMEFISAGPFGNRPVQYDDLQITYPASCPADLDGSGAVDLADLSLLLSQFGSTGAGLDGDIDGDGDVDLTDLAALLASFGSTC